MKMKHEIDTDTILRVIETLKGIDARGFDSMDRIVGLVKFFEDLLTAPYTGNGNEVK